MCRYTEHAYRNHHVCFHCRSAFKRGGSSDGQRCPSCGSPMHCMGMDFHRPRKSNDQEWRKLEALVAAGVRFHSCGCGGPGYRPPRLAGVKLFLRGRALRKVRESEPQVLLLKAALARQGRRPAETARVLDVGAPYCPGALE